MSEVHGNTVVENGKSFIKETLLRMKGDTDEAMAESNQRKAIAICAQEIAALQASKFQIDEEIIEAKDKVATAKYPIEALKATSKNYLFNIRSAKAVLEVKEDAMKDVEYSIGEVKALLAELKA
tara:strand:+ start:19 stop:390 length:372 start_codon:yes stop_codon:yes gene_type:complete